MISLMDIAGYKITGSKDTNLFCSNTWFMLPGISEMCYIDFICHQLCEKKPFSMYPSDFEY